MDTKTLAELMRPGDAPLNMEAMGAQLDQSVIRGQHLISEFGVCTLEDAADWGGDGVDVFNAVLSMVIGQTRGAVTAHLMDELHTGLQAAFRMGQACALASN